MLFWRKIGELAKAAEPDLAQTLMVDVCLKGLAPVLVASEGKREALCDMIYTFVRSDNANNRLAALKSVKDSLSALSTRTQTATNSNSAARPARSSKEIEHYVSLLSFFAPHDAPFLKQ